MFKDINLYDFTTKLFEVLYSPLLAVVTGS